jgi:hypothetical protein
METNVVGKRARRKQVEMRKAVKGEMEECDAGIVEGCSVLRKLRMTWVDVGWRS